MGQADTRSSGVFQGMRGPLELASMLLHDAAAAPPGVSTEAVYQLIDVAFRISLLTDEARRLTFTAYLPPEGVEVGEGALHVPFEELRFKPELVRGLGAAVPPRPYLLVVTFHGGKLWCQGVAGGEGRMRSRDGTWDGVYVTIHGPGHVSVVTGRASEVHLELRGGAIRRVPDVVQSGAFHAVCTQAARALLGGEDAPGSSPAVDVLRRVFGTVLSTALGLRHGGSFLVVSDEVAKGMQGTTIRFPTRGPDLGQAVLACCGDGRAPGATAEALRRARAIAHLSAVDGCVLLDQALRVLGFGAIMRFGDLPDCREVPVHATAGADGEQDHPPFDLGARGTRHQSAAWFCATHPGTRAFVVSQDQELRAFEHAGPGRVWACGPLGVLLGGSAPAA